MSSIFSRNDSRELIPRKHNFTIVVILSCASLILYIAASVLYVFALATHNIETDSFILVGVSIVEISITVFSLIASLVATYISDYYSDSCVLFIEHINRQNEPFFQNQDVRLLAEKTKQSLKAVRWIKLLVFVVFGIYFFLSVWHYISIITSAIQLTSIIVGSVSTIFTIVLALVSSISCSYIGKYTKKMLELLLEDNRKLFDLCSEMKIDQSYVIRS